MTQLYKINVKLSPNQKKNLVNHAKRKKLHQNNQMQNIMTTHCGFFVFALFKSNE